VTASIAVLGRATRAVRGHAEAERRVEFGAPAVTLLLLAGRENAELIVVGAGRSGRLAAALAAATTRPLLVVPADEPARLREMGRGPHGRNGVPAGILEAAAVAAGEGQRELA
jgi:hypothetical protein